MAWRILPNEMLAMNNFWRVGIACLCLVLSGCGFALRGVDTDIHLAPHHQSVHITTDTSQNALALKSSLNKHLQMLGISETAKHSQPNITISNPHFRRYELAGTLTEVRLVLMADVQYHFKERSYTYPIQAERSYQYNEASVSTDNQSDTVKTWLYDTLGERIAEQYQALAKHQ